MPLHIRIWSGLSYSLCFAMIISDCFLTGTFPAVSVPAQLAVKRYLGASTSVTAWQSFACDLINAAVPHLMEQQHVERPFLGDIDGPHYRGSQSLQMLYLVLERVHTALQTGSTSHSLGREGQLTVCVLVYIACIRCAKLVMFLPFFVMTSILC